MEREIRQKGESQKEANEKQTDVDYIFGRHPGKLLLKGITDENIGLVGSITLDERVGLIYSSDMQILEENLNVSIRQQGAARKLRLFAIRNSRIGNERVFHYQLIDLRKGVYYFQTKRLESVEKFFAEKIKPRLDNANRRSIRTILEKAGFLSFEVDIIFKFKIKIDNAIVVRNAALLRAGRVSHARKA